MPQNQQDIQDNERDIARMQPEETTLDLPEVKDIPGQEHIHVPRMKEFQDTTIASDDEEGVGIFEEDATDPESDVTDEERELLERSSESMAGPDDEERRSILPDHTDNEGDPLNEAVEFSGSDLDVPRFGGG